MPELDVNEILHAPARLNIMAALAAVGEEDRISYPRLREIVDLTPGNLTSHLRRLESAGYVSQTKRFVKRTPMTEIRMTRRGRREFDAYVAALRRFVEGVGGQEPPMSLPGFSRDAP